VKAQDELLGDVGVPDLLDGKELEEEEEEEEDSLIQDCWQLANSPSDILVVVVRHHSRAAYSVFMRSIQYDQN